MSGKFAEQYEGFFKELDQVTESQSIPKMEGFIHEALQFFETVRTKLTSDNEEERKEALDAAQKLQEKLAEQAEKAFKASGMTEEELAAFLENPGSFKPEELGSFQRAKEEIKEYESNVLKKPVPKIEKIKEAKIAPKNSKAPGASGKGDHWIPG